MKSEGRWQVGVAGAVVRRQHVLLVRHTYSEKGGRWALPGGFSSPNERLDESIVREILEETGLHTEVVDLIGLITRYGEKGGAVFVVFRLHPLAGQAKPDGVEVDRLGWFTAEEVAAMTADELWADIRNPTLAALVGGDGLAEDGHYPGRSDMARGFLVSVNLEVER
jgi:ADP-ribose pyrophosphatase YjhB (NUDIX family)